MHPRAKATVEDLYRIPDNGKAELVDGEIVLMSPTGGIPGRVAEAEPALPGWSMPVDDLLP